MHNWAPAEIYEQASLTLQTVARKVEKEEPNQTLGHQKTHKISKEDHKVKTKDLVDHKMCIMFSSQSGIPPLQYPKALTGFEYKGSFQKMFLFALNEIRDGPLLLPEVIMAQGVSCSKEYKLDFHTGEEVSQVV